MLGVSLLKVIFAFKDTFHANGTTFFFFFSEERNTYLFSICLYQRRSLFSFFLYIYVVYIYQFTFFYTFLGQAPYTHRVQRHATLALLLHSTVGWLAGIMSSRQCCIWWVSAPTLNTHTHRHFLPHSLSLLRHTHTTIHHVQLSSSQSRQRHTA